MSEIRPHAMREAGSIGGVPGPNSGLWPGGITVWINMDTMEVDHVDLIGGGSLVIPEVESVEQTPTDPALLTIQETPVQEPVPIIEQPAPAPIASSEVPQEEFPQVTPVQEEQINA